MPAQLIECQITKLSHEGRGIAKHHGKTQFVEGALVGETVRAQYLSQGSRYDELKCLEVMVAAPERVAPACAHFERCGGCSMQHLAEAEQLRFKQATLAEQLEHFGGIQPERWLAAITASAYGYRRRARLGVRYLARSKRMVLGFREKRSKQLCDIHECPILDPRIGKKLSPLRELLEGMANPQAITHVELAAGDDSLAMVFRHVEALPEQDYQRLREFARGQSQDAEELAIYLQPDNGGHLNKLWPQMGADRLYYHLPIAERASPLRLAFHPRDFTQVNAQVNQKMMAQALEWLDVQAHERVLDLFCGLGNFSLPLALSAAELVGVEGSENMVARAKENAAENGLMNTQFCVENLQADFSKAKWAKQGFDKILIDPPRSGALDVVQYLSKFKAKKVVYVSCNPATLARDAGQLIAAGYRLSKAGMMDMFAQTSHLEAIALFER